MHFNKIRTSVAHMPSLDVVDHRAASTRTPEIRLSDTGIIGPSRCEARTHAVALIAYVGALGVLNLIGLVVLLAEEARLKRVPNAATWDVYSNAAYLLVVFAYGIRVSCMGLTTSPRAYAAIRDIQRYGLLLFAVSTAHHMFQNDAYLSEEFYADIGIARSNAEGPVYVRAVDFVVGRCALPYVLYRTLRVRDVLRLALQGRSPRTIALVLYAADVASALCGLVDVFCAIHEPFGMLPVLVTMVGATCVVVVTFATTATCSGRVRVVVRECVQRWPIGLSVANSSCVIASLALTVASKRMDHAHPGFSGLLHSFWHFSTASLIVCGTSCLLEHKHLE